MSKKEYSAILEDMKEAIKRIMSYSKNMTYEDFACDDKTQDATIKNIEILGEAA
jgi:uncharacterized protein with HEPN domain